MSLLQLELTPLETRRSNRHTDGSADGWGNGDGDGDGSRVSRIRTADFGDGSGWLDGSSGGLDRDSGYIHGSGGGGGWGDGRGELNGTGEG